MSTGDYEKLVSINQAAKELHRDRVYLMELARKRGLLIRAPGQKRAKVLIDDLKLVLMGRPKSSHPLVKC